ncbi:MAG: hypothetical protein JF887_09850 [Candidatus Dormibacteraeota bacterium]|uniref:Uncharacterized protein n=1 Tax=Candidatus Amunia macphersoniae TaxID=3127014 RepID=A0A934NA36_9BACT|nr:hypothetical protein [Candidatus Dormibacteraeota bacterium]
MFGRKSKKAVIEREVSNAGSRAAEVVSEAASDFAERAVAAAQNAQRVAAPVLRTAAERSAETLSHAAERAAVVLADVGERLAESGEERAGQAAIAARERLANASEALAVAVRPKKRRRFRRLLLVGLLIAGLAALARSPLRTKLTDRLFGSTSEFEDDAPESITLPRAAAPSETTVPEEQAEPTPPTSEGAETEGGSNGVVSNATQPTGDGASS